MDKLKLLLIIFTISLSTFTLADVPCIEKVNELDLTNKSVAINSIVKCAEESNLISIKQIDTFKMKLINRKNLDKNFIKKELTSKYLIASLNTDIKIIETKVVEKGRDYISDPSLNIGNPKKAQPTGQSKGIAH